ncbi:dihydropteroate synthase [Sinorhizobium medicae]|uniref:dihydropteroate synthase n=1 Tax=Sinorhizobium medicae TaxID=110321 RepID=UPI0012956F28|nr:dihydropteroate synthase [Sinorhizobium medicae]MDX0629358.1 dihydropteroate synthase [Sinorhizobium medicae]MDX0881678.1 dihydropteroate synthase [Sinorhizobium medicae]MQX51314.1 dihydropteroate synthase [Sinorhizobium medicae]
MTYDPFQTFRWQLAHGRVLELGLRGVLMAVINVTPDSFSDGGRFVKAGAAVDAALRAVEAGAEILDIGGESTRPDAEPVSSGEEQGRILPVISAIARQSRAVISVDTYRAETARLAVEAGAHIVNDVHGLQREPAIATVAAETGAGLCIMHTGRAREKLPDVIQDQFHFLERSLQIATDAGVRRDQVVLDPGFGFAKDTDENLELMARFAELHRFRMPLLVGTSRKRFLGAVTAQEAQDRDVGTAATTALLRTAGAAIFRVHDVAINRDALAVSDAMLAAKNSRRDTKS